MLKLLLKTLGWTVAHAPEAGLRLIAAGLGDLIFFTLPRRRRLVLSNLHHAFPERARAWHRRVGRESCRRLIETAMLSLATPFLDATRLRKMVTASPELLAVYADHRREPAATLICSPHIAYWETQTAMSLIVPEPFPEFGTIFRPLDNAAANAWVQRSRERFGMRLLSRKEGFQEALRILRRQGFVGVLFDQNAGLQGALTTLFGRVCSTTELPGLMAEKFAARVYGIFPRRRSFWRIEIGTARIDHGGSASSVTLALNRWLESVLSRDENLCASWLWAHDRWRNQDIPALRFRLEARRNLLAEDLRARGWSQLPRKTRIWVRMPNWLGDVIMALPLIEALQRGRPDAELRLVVKPALAPLLQSLGWQVEPLPARGLGYFRHFWKRRDLYPDVYVLFTNSTRGDIEAWLTGARQRFGVLRPGKRRPLLTHAFRVPPDFDEQRHHQLELWTQFLRAFGLQQAPVTSVQHPPTPQTDRVTFGFIPGSENMPAKRWPVDAWRTLATELLEEHPGAEIRLFGTNNDRALTQAIAAGFPAGSMVDLAGKTSITDYMQRLRECRLLVTNDTGGMHLANALGVPLIALFGPTNPLRTGPVFAAPAHILQPPNCPPTGGGSLSDLTPAAVRAAVRQALATLPACE